MSNFNNFRVSIVIPTYNHLDDYLKPCLEQLQKNTDLSDPNQIEVIIVANGCTDGTAHYIRSLGSAFKVIEHPNPLGYLVATNLGICNAQGNFIVLLNNDCQVLAPNWLDILLQPFSSDGVGITGPVMMWDAEIMRQYLMFFCVAIRRDVFDWIGVLDVEYENGYCEDIDFCVRAVNAGWKIEQVPDAVTLEESKLPKTQFPFPIYHPSHGTYGDEHKVLTARNRQRLLSKWGTIAGNYITRLKIANDIFQHLPILYEYAIECDSIVEMGVRHVHSTYAFLASHPRKMVSYDIASCPMIEPALEMAKRDGLDFTFHQADALKVDIETTDFLFIDTWHVYDQLKKELHIHAPKVNKYIGLHDTEHFGQIGETEGYRGLQPAVDEFLSSNKNWHVKEIWKRNNGLTILERKTEKKHISIIIPTYNHLEDCLKPCIESILKYTNMDEVEVIIVANGCTDATREYVKSLGSHFRLIWLEEASGYTKSTNYGIKAAQGDFIILLNNDTELLPQDKDDWIKKMLEPMEDSKMGATGPLALRDPYAQERILIFFCCMIRKEVFDKVGLLDEIFHPGGGEDVDFTARMTRMGYKWLQVPDHNPLQRTHTNTGAFGIWHKDNRTFSEMIEYTLTIIKRNGLINLKRYGKVIKLKLNSTETGKDDDFLTVHPEAHPALLKMPYERLDFENGSVDEIIACDLEVTEERLTEWQRVLKPDGKIITDTNGHRQNIVDHTPKVYDCFMFFDELDLLEVRLKTLWNVVDKFVLVESPVTHSNKPKELIFEKHKNRFQPYLHKIKHIVFNEMERGNHWESHWERERDQRNSIALGLQDARENDIIMLSDIDEIPHPEVIHRYAREEGLFKLQQRLYYYYLNCQCDEIWDKAVIFRKRLLNEYTPQEIRENIKTRNVGCFSNGGWHFSYIGGVKQIQNKLESTLHVELNRPEINNIENIRQSMSNGRDLFGRNVQFTFTDIDETFPIPVRENERGLTRMGLIRGSLVYDCFPFFNELDILEIRINELDDVVDYFVLCEMPVTHKGDLKPLYFLQNKERFSKWKDRIIHIVPKEWPTDIDPWSRERFQRDACWEALGLNDEDIVIGSDVDEIPRSTVVAEYEPSMGLCAFRQRRFNYYLNLDHGYDEQASGVFSKIISWGELKHMPGKLCELRYSQPKSTLIDPGTGEGGWHFSYQGGAQAVIQKLRSWAHQEWNRPEYTNPDDLKKKMEAGVDPLNNKPCHFIDVHTPELPKFVVDNAPTLNAKGMIHYMPDIDAKLKNPEVTAYISTKDRYFTTLPLAVYAIINQTYPVKKLIIWDDGEHKDLRDVSPYRELFCILSIKGIEWYFLLAPRKGQVANHQATIDMDMTTEWLWRVDDDDAPEPDCLEKLVRNIAPGVGAIGGLVHLPSQQPVPPSLCSGRIEDVYGFNLQWSQFEGVREVDQLHNTFLYRKSASKHGYPKNLSPVGHREETIFTYEMKRAGWKLLIDPEAKTWHLRNQNGGIRCFTEENYNKDEAIFKQKFQEWGLTPRKDKLFIVDGGLGDHMCFKMILPEIKNKYKGYRILLANCYPELFKNDDVELLSVAEGSILENPDNHNIYRWCWENNWDSSKGNLVEAYRKMYLKNF